jgi:hypothetical protein
MADLTQDSPIRLLGTAFTEKFPIDTAAARTFYKGQPVMIDQDVDAAHVVQYVTALATAIDDVCVGIAAEKASVAIGDPETTYIETYVGPSIIGFPSGVFGVADIGKTVLMSDSGTLSITTLENPIIGKLVNVKDGYAYVKLTTPIVCTTAGA